MNKAPTMFERDWDGDRGAVAQAVTNPEEKNVEFAKNHLVTAWLPPAELDAVTQHKDHAGRFIGLTVDHEARTLTLIRGDRRELTIPLATFKESGDGAIPDFSRAQIIDYGCAVAFGDYEAAADAILDEHKLESR